MLETLFRIILCHLLGDYVLQSRHIAENKGQNWYLLFVHCFLYVLPFYLVFGFNWKLAVLLIAHILVDPLKARWGIIGYYQDQLIHYLTAVILYMVL